MLGMKNHFDISGSIEIREVDIAGVACISIELVLFVDSGHNIYNNHITIRSSAKWILIPESHFGSILTGFKFDQYDTD